MQEETLDLVELVNKQLSVTVSKPPDGKLSTEDKESIRTIFGFMRALTFSRNIERLNANHLYHEGLQRLARGMLLPLLLASIVVWQHKSPGWPLLIAVFIILAISSYALLLHSLKTEEDQLIRFFVAWTKSDQRIAQG